MIDPVKRQLGKKYPEEPEELVREVQRVIGPVLAELRQRFNELGPQLAYQIEENEADILLVDTTNMMKFTQMTNAETGDVYYLDPAGTPGVSDLAANPTGAWVYSQTL